MRTGFASSNRLRTFFGYGNELSEAYKLVLDFFWNWLRFRYVCRVVMKYIVLGTLVFKHGKFMRFWAIKVWFQWQCEPSAWLECVWITKYHRKSNWHFDCYALALTLPGKYIIGRRKKVTEMPAKPLARREYIRLLNFSMRSGFFFHSHSKNRRTQMWERCVNLIHTHLFYRRFEFYLQLVLALFYLCSFLFARFGGEYAFRPNERP